jgi:hypothetical protein
MIISKEMWNEFNNILGKDFNFTSQEALGDEFDASPQGGSSEDDAETNDEQFNEDSSSFDDFGDDLGFSDDGSSGFDEFSDSGGLGGDMSGGGGGGSGLGTALDPIKNPFKGQNGRNILDSKLAELYVSAKNTLETIQENSDNSGEIISELTTLLENITKIREVVFIQPIETSQYRWALCVKAYELICKAFCTNIEKAKFKNTSVEEQYGNSSD